MIMMSGMSIDGFWKLPQMMKSLNYMRLLFKATWPSTQFFLLLIIWGVGGGGELGKPIESKLIKM